MENILHRDYYQYIAALNFIHLIVIFMRSVLRKSGISAEKREINTRMGLFWGEKRDLVWLKGNFGNSEYSLLDVGSV